MLHQTDRELIYHSFVQQRKSIEVYAIEKKQRFNFDAKLLLL